MKTLDEIYHSITPGTISEETLQTAAAQADVEGQIRLGRVEDLAKYMARKNHLSVGIFMTPTSSARKVCLNVALFRFDSDLAVRFAWSLCGAKLIKIVYPPTS